MTHYRMIVFSNPVAGQEDAFNHWYDERHIPDVLAIPGFVGAQRYRANPARGEPPRGYLTIYDLETDDVTAVLADLKSRSRTEKMPISEALAPESITYLFEAIGPHVRA